MSASNNAIMAPVPVGTQGTVGSLIRKEIEYFRRMLPMTTAHGSDKYYYDTPTPTPKRKVLDHPRQSSSSSTHSICLLGMSWKSKKKQRVSACCGNQRSTVLVDKNVISGFSYVNIKDDGWIQSE